MDNVCLKYSNQSKLRQQLNRYPESSRYHVFLQLVWDRKENKMRLQDIYNRLRTMKYEWFWYPTPTIDDDLDVEPGVLTCNRCNNNRIMTKNRQTRSGDEGQTVFAMCIVCKHTWTCTN